jgi:osmotically-inducible protein OsmY
VIAGNVMHAGGGTLLRRRPDLSLDAANRTDVQIFDGDVCTVLEVADGLGEGLGTCAWVRVCKAGVGDGWLSTKVKTTLLFHRNVSASKTDVFVQNGVVSLRGEAVNLAQKELTGEYAKDVEGVKEVKNEMTLARTPTIPTEPQVDRIDDASITAQVKASLLSHRSTSALKTKVQTRDGVVTLSGSAKNEAEKSLVTKLVSDINGVISVVNNMTVGVPVAKD